MSKYKEETGLNQSDILLEQEEHEEQKKQEEQEEQD